MTRETTLPEVGRRFSAARLRRGLSQGTVARRAGIAASYLSRIETGKIQPTFRTAMKILLAMDADADEIVGPHATRDRQKRGCPVSSEGRCLLDLIRQESLPAAGKGPESYTPRQIRLLRRMAGWIRHASSDRLRAMEILLEDLTPKRP
jgi:transcriptional regulator with XRE-family HTH domain